MMASLLESADDRLHCPGSAATWRESYFFAFHDAAGRAVMSYISLAPHQGVAERLVMLLLPAEGRTLVWMQQEPLRRFEDAALVEGAVQFLCSTPLQGWQLRAEAPCLSVPAAQEISAVLAAARADPGPFERLLIAFGVQFEASMPAYRFPAGAWDFLGQGQDHFEQMGQVRGWLRLGDQETAVAGPGSRDRSWGARDWLRHEWYQWIHLHLGQDLLIGAALSQADGRESSSGFVYQEGLLQPVVRAAVEAERDAADLHLLSGTLHLATEQGQTLAVDLAPTSFLHTIVARDQVRQNHDTYTALTCRCAGRTGRGFLEYARKEPLPSAAPRQAGLW
jgi:hypothetical protein